MKESKYNIYVKAGAKTLCFNTISNSFALMPQKLYGQVQAGSFDEIDEKELQTLTDNNILIADEENELENFIANYKAAVSEDSETYELTLLPSLDCNVKCWYCFETHVRGSHIDALTSEAIYKHVEGVCRKENIRHIHIELFGGEPLLYFEEELYPLLERSFASSLTRAFQ